MKFVFLCLAQYREEDCNCLSHTHPLGLISQDKISCIYTMCLMPRIVNKTKQANKQKQMEMNRFYSLACRNTNTEGYWSSDIKLCICSLDYKCSIRLVLQPGGRCASKVFICWTEWKAGIRVRRPDEGKMTIYFWHLFREVEFRRKKQKQRNKQVRLLGELDYITGKQK